MNFILSKDCSVPAGRAVWHAKTEEVVPPTETGFPCGSTLGKLDLWRSDPVQSGSDRGTDKPTVHQGENRQAWRITYTWKYTFIRQKVHKWSAFFKEILSPPAIAPPVQWMPEED